MPTQYGPYRPRGFAPLFRNPALDQNMRVSDAERQAVTDRLSEHYAEGRLDQAEFDDRSGRALSAKTRADLNGLFDDLPAPAVPPSPQLPQLRSRRRAHPGVVLALIVLIALTAGHAVAWLWLGLLAVALLAVSRRISRPRTNQ